MKVDQFNELVQLFEAYSMLISILFNPMKMMKVGRLPNTSSIISTAVCDHVSQIIYINRLTTLRVV